MLKFILINLLCFQVSLFCANLVFAQEAEDSTKKEPKEAQSVDKVDEIDLSTLSWDELMDKGDQFKKNGDLSKAEECYRAAKELSDDFESVDLRRLDTLEKLATLLYKRDKLKDAIDALDGADNFTRFLPDGEMSDRKLRIVFRLAKLHYEAGLPIKGLKVAKRAEQMLLNNETEDFMLQPRIYNLLGAFYRDSGQLGKSETMLDRAMKLIDLSCPKVDGEGKFPTNLSRENKRMMILKGRVLANKSELKALFPGDKESKKLSKESKKFFKAGYGKNSNHAEYIELSVVEKLQAKKSNLEDYKKLIAGIEEKHGKDCLLTAKIKVNIAMWCINNAKFPLALKSCQQALKIRSLLLPRDSKYIADSYGDIGLIYLSLKQARNAASNFKQAYDICKNTCGENSPQLSNYSTQLGVAYGTTGQLDQAEKFLYEAWRINEALFGRENDVVLDNLTNLGAVYLAQRKWKQGLRYTYWAYQLVEKLYGPNDSRMSISASNLGALYMALGDNVKAEKYFRQVITIRAKNGTNTVSYADALKKMAELYAKKGNVMKAYNYIRQAFNIEEKRLGLTHPTTYSTLTIYHGLMKKLGKSSQAQALSVRYKKARANQMRKRATK